MPFATQAPALTKKWDSGQLSIAVGNNTVSHTLGVMPDVIIKYLECTTNDNGYLAGDRIAIDANNDQKDNLAVTSAQIAYGWIGGDINYTTKQGRTALAGSITLTPANWRLRVLLFA